MKSGRWKSIDGCQYIYPAVIGEKGWRNQVLLYTQQRTCIEKEGMFALCLPDQYTVKKKERKRKVTRGRKCACLCGCRSLYSLARRRKKIKKKKK